MTGHIGKPAVSRISPTCCGKPHGCNNPTDACLYKQHPYKRCERGEITSEECVVLMGLKEEVA